MKSVNSYLLIIIDRQVPVQMTNIEYHSSRRHLIPVLHCISYLLNIGTWTVAAQPAFDICIHTISIPLHCTWKVVAEIQYDSSCASLGESSSAVCSKAIIVFQLDVSF